MSDAFKQLSVADATLIAAFVLAILIAIVAVMYVRHRNAIVATENDPEAVRQQFRHAAMEILGAVVAGVAVLLFILLGWNWWLLAFAAFLFVALWLLSFLELSGAMGWVLRNTQLLRVIIPAVTMFVGYAEEHLSSGLDASNPELATVSAEDLRDYGVEYAHSLLVPVQDLDRRERARIENRVEKDLRDLSGSETPAAVRVRVRKILADEDL
jgi:hypothetical protein